MERRNVCVCLLVFLILIVPIGTIFARVWPDNVLGLQYTIIAINPSGTECWTPAPNDINNSGYLVGYTYVITDSNCFYDRAYRWAESSGAIILPEGLRSAAMAINNSGQVVGGITVYSDTSKSGEVGDHDGG